MIKKILAVIAILLIVGVGGLFLFKPDHAPVIASPTKTYVALGDSVAAGIGLDGDSDSSACDRTNQSYPVVTAQRGGYSLHSVACSGATISNGIIGKQSVNDLLVKPQLDQLFQQPKPDLITITIGANDAGWGDVITACYLRQCGSAQDTAKIDAKLSALTNNLQDMFEKLQTHYHFTQPSVVVTDYYQVYPASKPETCGSLIGISGDELTWLREQRSKINTVIQTAVAGQPYAVLAQTDFSGHELCSSDSWVQGLTAKEPYHPTAAGQKAIAAQVLASLKKAKQ